MKKVTLYSFPIVTLLFVLIVWQVVSSQYNNIDTISIEEAIASMPDSLGTALTTDGRIDLNTATVKEITLLPGIGEKLAGRILSYRETNGPFTCPEDLLNISGIGLKKLCAIIEYIYIS